MSVAAQVTRVSGGVPEPERIDRLVEEIPVALVYNGISHAVMMCSPVDLADFALGFSLSEGILQSPDQLYDLDILTQPQGISVEMDIAGAPFAALKDRRRQLTGRSGCGLCGVDSLSQAIRPVTTVTGVNPAPEAIERALSQLPEQQIEGQATGACHAAAWVSPEGSIGTVREDVGRHNALDKLIGAYQGTFGPGFALITSRASYEMVHKACAAGIGALVAVSAPTSLAVSMAEQAGLTLIGFARGSRHQHYGTSHADTH